MAEEIERKFLVSHDGWRARISRSRRLRQGYLAVTERCAVRVRIDGERGIVGVKSAGLETRRKEFEYAVPVAEAEEMLELVTCGVIEKVRHEVDHAGHLWEIDEFAGANTGLVLAEVELAALDEHVEIPDWAGPEVSGDPRYFNSSLAERPYRSWETR